MVDATEAQGVFERVEKLIDRVEALQKENAELKETIERIRANGAETKHEEN